MKPFSALVVGYGGHGKDAFATLLAENLRIKYCSSSHFACEKVVLPWFNINLPGKYANVQECFDDRRNNRELWHRLISDYNRPDRTRLAKEVLAEHDIYIGMRSIDELRACIDSNLFNVIFWVDGLKRQAPESGGSNSIHFDPTFMCYVDSNGPLGALPAVAMRWAKIMRLRYQREHGTPWPSL